MSQPNANRRWIFERDLYDENCTLLRPQVADRINRPCVTQYVLFPELDLVATEVTRVDVMGKSGNAERS